jgi:hypothetical protein
MLRNATVSEEDMCLCRFRREADCADGLRGRFLEVTGNRHAADYVPFAFFLGDVFVLTIVVVT